MRLQGLYGTIPQVKGKGPHALAVKNLLTLMRKEMGAKAPRTGHHSQTCQQIVVDWHY